MPSCVGEDFAIYKFCALNAPDPAGRRTFPDRLGDIIDVKDWGAKGDNSTDDSNAIQAAITYAIGGSGTGRPNNSTGGTVFFPSGQYVCNTPPKVGSNTVNAGVIIAGATTTAVITCGLSAGGLANDCLERVCFLTVQGPIILTRPNASIQGVVGGGTPAFDTSAGNGALISDCTVTGPSRFAAYNSPHLVSTQSVAFVVGSNTTVRNCRVQGGYGVCYAISGNGASVLGCATEDNTVGVRLGWGYVSPGVFGEVPAVGCSIINTQTERTDTQFELYNAVGCFIGGVLSGNTFEGTPDPEGGITNMVWSAGSPPTVAVTTAQPHNIGSINTVARLQIVNPNPAGFAVPSLPAGWVLATVTGASSFTYSAPGITSNPGTFVSATGWNWPMSYGIRARIANQCTIQANTLGANDATAHVDLDYGGDAAANHQNSVILGQLANQGWIPPRAKNRAGWKYVQCTGSINPFDATYGAGSAGLPTTFSTPYAQMNFADLPGGASASNQPGPFEGQEYDIIDSTLAASGNFGGTPAGGGSNHVKLRYVAGSINNWTIIG